MMRIGLLLLVSGLLASCVNGHKAERTRLADVMDDLDRAKARFEHLHPDSLPMNYSDIDGRLDYITRNFPDQVKEMDMETGNLLADFRVFKKVFKGLPEKRQKIAAEIDKSYEQLTALDHDLKHDKVPGDKIARYLDDEEQATMALLASVEQLDTLFARGSRGYLALRPRIDSLTQAWAEVAERNEN